MSNQPRRPNGEFSFAIGDGKTNTPKPGFRIGHKNPSPKEIEIASIEENFNSATKMAQEEYHETLKDVKATLIDKMEPKARKLFDKYGFIQDFDEVKSIDGFVNVPSIVKAEYDLAKAQAKLKLLSVLTPAMLNRERDLLLVAKKYPKKHWFKSK